MGPHTGTMRCNLRLYLMRLVTNKYIHASPPAVRSWKDPISIKGKPILATFAKYRPAAARMKADVPLRGSLVEAGGSAARGEAGRTAAQTLLYTICNPASAITLALASPPRRAPSAPATLQYRRPFSSGRWAASVLQIRLHAGSLDSIQLWEFRR